MERRFHYGVSGTPTVLFDGGLVAVGINPPPVIDRYRARIDVQREVPAQISLALEASYVPDLGSVRTRVRASVADGEFIDEIGECRIRALLYENEVSAGGTFQHVVRTVFLDQSLTVETSGEEQETNASVAIEESWKPADLFMVAWVERSSNKQILQAARVPVGDPTPVISTSWGRIKRSYGGSTN
ncbi:MAG: hypothetical protein R3E12_18040 [Candidatus Eisenbacteria bacterium]